MAVRMTLEELRRLMPDIDERLCWDRRETADAALVACGLPVAVQVERDAGRWLVRVANWCPASDNVRAKGLKAWMRAKKRDREVVRDWLVVHARVPPATGPRRLRVLVEKKGNLPDPSNLNKSLRDALVSCGLLIDDDAARLEGSEPKVSRAKVTSTLILLEDIAS
jgi:hypothetical protein